MRPDRFAFGENLSGLFQEILLSRCQIIEPVADIGVVQVVLETLHIVRIYESNFGVEEEGGWGLIYHEVLRFSVLGE